MSDTNDTLPPPGSGDLIPMDMDGELDEVVADVAALLSKDSMVPCSKCRRVWYLGNDGIFILRTAGIGLYSYKVYCPDCWETVRPGIEWVGVITAIVYDPIAVHSLFGNPFGRLMPVDGGRILFANEVKQRQLELF